MRREELTCMRIANISTAIEKPRILLDTNVLLRFQKLVLFTETKDGLKITRPGELITARFQPCICFQNIVEFWAVAGRPIKENGLNLSLESIYHQVQRFRKTFVLIPDKPEAVDIWINLCNNYSISGRKVHDARLASTAIANGINTVLTQNIADFHGFKEISVLEPNFEN